MTAPKRYESPNQLTDMVECEDGEWVRWEDYERALDLLREIRQFGLDDSTAGERELYDKIDEALNK